MTASEQGHAPHPHPGTYSVAPLLRKPLVVPEASPAAAVLISELRMRADETLTRLREARKIPEPYSRVMLDCAETHLNTARGYLGLQGHAGFEAGPAVEPASRALAWSAAYLDVGVQGARLPDAFVARWNELMDAMDAARAHGGGA